MSLDEIGQWVRTLRRRLATVLLTGGEPFLRRDLAEICLVFDRENSTRQMTIPTNGSQPLRIEQQLQRILQSTRLDLSVQVSLDGLRATHDARRGLDGSFDLAVETARRLRKIADSTSRLRCFVTTVVSKDNLNEVVALRKFVISDLQIGHNAQVERGTHTSVHNLPEEIASDFDPLPGTPGAPDLGELADVDQQLDVAFGPTPDFHQRLDILKRRHLQHVARTGTRPFKCQAGRLDAVVLPEGEVAICEMTQPFSNLRDHGLDFAKLWGSPEAERARALTQRCACTHSCNISNSMKYDKVTLEALAGLGGSERALPAVAAPANQE